MVKTRTGSLTNPSRLPSPIFNLVSTVSFLLESDYCNDEYAPDDMISNL